MAAWVHWNNGTNGRRDNNTNKGTTARAACVILPHEQCKIKPTNKIRTEQLMDYEKQAIIPLPFVRAIAQLDNIYEVRLFGWVIAKAQSVLKLYNKDLREINIEQAMNLTRVTIPARYLLVEGDKNYNHIKKAFDLQQKKIVYERNNTEYHLNIIAFPELRKQENGALMLTFVIHNELWHALLDFSKGYRLFLMSTFMRLTSTYSIIMYILCTQQKEPIRMQLGTLRRLMGVEGKKSYNRGGNFFARCVDQAKKELDQKSPYTFDYTASKAGSSGKYDEIVIIPHKNDKTTAAETKTEKERKEQIVILRARLDDRVKDYLQYSFGMNAREVEQVEGLVQAIDEDPLRQIGRLARIKEAAAHKRVRNFAGYLVTSLRNEQQKG